MTVCKHCGTEIENGIEYCPNCGQSIDERYGDFFEPDEGLEEEAYNIFDTPEEFDMDTLLEKEFEYEIAQSRPAPIAPEPENVETYTEPEEPFEDSFFPMEEESNGVECLQEDVPTEPVNNLTEETDDLAELLGLFGEEPSEASAEPSIMEFVPPEDTAAPEIEDLNGMEFPVAEETDFFALDDLFQDMDGEPAEIKADSGIVDLGLEELLAAGTTSDEGKESKKKKDKKKEKKSFFKAIFGNVPIDPSKIKPEPTPEQIAAKKEKEAAEKKAIAEEKKLVAEEKKQNAQRDKEEKARAKALAKEEKKEKKLLEAKMILEEMKETRINRVGATIVFLFFAVCAILLLSGSEIFGYTISIHNAENNFNKAYDNNVKYYTDAYNDIYGLDIKEKDRLLREKIMTVMFVNKELNSFNSYMILEDYQAALHSLLLGLYRYGKYYEQAIPLGISKDMDYVRTQILKELKTTFHVSEDEAEVLRKMLDDAGAGGMNTIVDPSAAREYNLGLYKIVEESGLNDDSNN